VSDRDEWRAALRGSQPTGICQQGRHDMVQLRDRGGVCTVCGIVVTADEVR
jgi:hypothetical protein